MSDNSNSSAMGGNKLMPHTHNRRSPDSSLASEEAPVATSAQPTWMLNAWGPRHIHLILKLFLNSLETTTLKCTET
jgi:hypothetical protein